MKAALNIVLVVAILGYFGVETQVLPPWWWAWPGHRRRLVGLLANFAAGAFLIVFRPYKVGDYVLAGGVEGTVEEIGLFNTT